jgi:hypothetical protein
MNAWTRIEFDKPLSYMYRVKHGAPPRVYVETNSLATVQWVCHRKGWPNIINYSRCTHTTDTGSSLKYMIPRERRHEVDAWLLEELDAGCVFIDKAEIAQLGIYEYA